MGQTAAIFHDAYRELNARKLFWITMILSGLVVAVFLMIGINTQGLRIIVWDIPAPLNTELMSEELFYKSMFLNLGVGFWLSWLAAILALVSTASIFPDFISGGAIDMVLSKPIGRLRLFLTKYVTGLLFVALQVTVFSVAAFVVLGLKAGAWEPAVFLSIPLVVLFFSYLFCVCSLLGLVTRSTIAALMLTLLFWFLIYAVHSTEASLLFFKLGQEQQVRGLVQSIEHEEGLIERLRAAETPNETAIARFEASVTKAHSDLESAKATVGTLDVAHRISMAVKTVLPKTTETVNLLERQLIDLAELKDPMERQTEQNQHRRAEVSGDGPIVRSNHMNSEAAQLELVEALRERPLWWIIGTSLLFEFVVLALAGFIFIRRDF